MDKKVKAKLVCSNFKLTPPPPEGKQLLIIARVDALAAIQRRLFSTDYEGLQAIMRVIYPSDPVKVVSHIEVKEGSPEADAYAKVLNTFE